MILEHSFTVPTDAATTWRTLLDVEQVAPCMPGARLDSIDGDDFTGQVRVKIGAIQMAYKMEGRFADKNEAERIAVIEGAGKEKRGGGNVRATIQLHVVPAGAHTEVRVETDLAITGKPAQFGRGALDDIGAKILGQFAANLSAMIAADEEPVQEAGGAEAAPARPSAEAAVSAPAGTSVSHSQARSTAEPEQLDLMSVIAPSPDRIIAVTSSVTALVLALLLLRRSAAQS